MTDTISGCLRSESDLSWFNWWVSFAPEFHVAISVNPHVCFILVLILVSMFLRECIDELGIFHANRTTKCLLNQGRTKGEGWSTAN